MEIVRKYLTPDEVSPANIRTNPTTGEVEISPDGGTTWNDAPQLDPRHADAYRLPPLTSGTARCDAAARIVAEWREQIVRLTGTVGVVEISTGVIGVLIVLSGGAAAVLFAIIFGVLEAIAIIGTGAIIAAFTSTVYDSLVCIVYNNIGTDGQVSAAQADAIMAEIASAYPGTIYNTIVQVQSLYGEVLLSNAGVTRTETGDCSACATWCVLFDFRDGVHGFAAQEFDVPGEPVGILTSLGWETEYTSDAAFGFRSVNIGRDFSAFTLLTADIQFREGVKGNFTGAPAAAFRADLFTASGQEVGNGDPVGDFVLHAENPNGAGWNLLARMGDANDPGNGDPGGNIVIESVVLTGIGDKPTGGIDC